MNVEVITPEKILYNGETIMVRVPGSLGSFQILKNHAPIVSSLEKGEITIRKPDGSEIKFDVNGGIVECKLNKVIILID